MDPFIQAILTPSSAILAGQMHLSIQQHPSMNTGDMCIHSISTWAHMHNPTSPGSSSPYQATTPDFWYQPPPNLFTVGKSKGTTRMR